MIKRSGLFWPSIYFIHLEFHDSKGIVSGKEPLMKTSSSRGRDKDF